MRYKIYKIYGKQTHVLLLICYRYLTLFIFGHLMRFNEIHFARVQYDVDTRAELMTSLTAVSYKDIFNGYFWDFTA